MSEKQYDIVLLGASGFTGRFVLEELLRVCKEKKVCAAGRNEAKVKGVVEEAGKCLGMITDHISIEVVDVADEAGVEALAAKTKLVMSVVGPYREHGFSVVSACVRGGADFIDISGEPQYLETVQIKLSDTAREKGVLVVGSCAFDSVPADMGVVTLRDNFPGNLEWVEMVAGHEGGETVIHATTLQCAVLGYANRRQLGTIRRKLMPEKLEKPASRPPKRGSLWYSEDAGKWCMANIGADRSVVTRSQYLLNQQDGRSPVHFDAYFGMESLGSAIKGLVFGLIFLLMNASSCTRDLLIKYPYIFSLGMFSWAGPSRENLVNNSFCVTLSGSGTDSSGQKITRKCKVIGPDPGYIGTAIMFVACGRTILEERDSLLVKSGVVTPATVFHKSGLLKRLSDRGITFTVE